MKIFVFSINGASVKKFTKLNIYYSESIIHVLVLTSASQLLFVDCRWITGVLRVLKVGLGAVIVLTPVISGVDCYPSVLYKVYGLQMSR